MANGDVLTSSGSLNKSTLPRTRRAHNSKYDCIFRSTVWGFCSRTVWHFWAFRECYDNKVLEWMAMKSSGSGNRG